MCEQNLRFSLFEFFDALDEEDCQVEARGVAGDEENSPNIKMEIIDFCFVSGYMSMSREECRLNGVYKFEKYKMPPHRTMMVAPFAALNNIEIMRSHLQLMVRIQSNVGLRLVDKKTQEKYP